MQRDVDLSFNINMKEHDEKGVANALGPGKTQRGFITNYLTSLSTDQIIANTLTGFLVNLIRKRGNLMQFSNILAYTQNRIETLRRPNGKPYNFTSGSHKRSIMCSLTSNGVFQKVPYPIVALGQESSASARNTTD